MKNDIIELTIRDKILEYTGFNNQIIDWKQKLLKNKNYTITRTQIEYIKKYYDIVPKVVKRKVKIVDSFAEKIMKERGLITFPEDGLWIEKLLCESDKAYHILSKILETDTLQTMWIPKTAIIPEEKKLNRVIDYTKYSHRPLLEHQKSAVEKLLTNDRFILADDMGLGKGLEVNTFIYTPKGKKKISEIKIGDDVIGDDGKTYQVTGVYPQGLKQLYKITFNDNFSVRTDEEHLWQTLSQKKVKTKVLSTKELFDNKNFDFNQLPIVKPIEFEKNKLPIVPRKLGEYLSKKGQFLEDAAFVKDKKITKYLENEIKSIGLNSIKEDDKFIPDIYKYSSIDDRYSVLEGLFETDLEIKVSRKFRYTDINYETYSEKLCNDICEVVQGLGGFAIKKTIKYNPRNDNKTFYKIQIILPGSVNRGEPKKQKFTKKIKDIQLDGFGETICISVNNPSKLYVIEHGIVTHNTTAAVVASIESDVKKVLVVCPASLKINWKKEIELYSNDKIIIVEGKKWGSTFKYYIINYDIVKNFHTTEKSEDSDDYKLILNQNFDLAIVDEAHMISNVAAKRTKLLNDILDKIPKVWLLTGTPMTSRPINFYNILKIVRSPLANNWQTYVRRYCGGYQFTVDGKKIWNTSGATNLDELRETTKNVVLRRLKSEILDLPEKIISPIYLELNNKMYSEEMEDFIKITKEQKKSDNISVSLNRLMKVRQLIANEKLPYTIELIDKYLELNKKIIVFTNFTLPIDVLHEKYKKQSVVLDGRMSKEKRQYSVDKFQNDDKVKIFLANIKSGGVGITLTEAEVVIMNDLSFVPSDHSQAEDRSYRYGQEKNVIVYYPIFENTIEMIIYNILQRKKNIIETVMGDNEYSESFVKELYKAIL
jgi:SNF2 family DNA or RNA helicase